MKKGVKREPQSRNALVRAVAQRAKELTDWKMDSLRNQYAQGGSMAEDLISRPHVREVRAMGRSQLIEAILVTEFCTTPDREF